MFTDKSKLYKFQPIKQVREEREIKRKITKEYRPTIIHKLAIKYGSMNSKSRISYCDINSAMTLLYTRSFSEIDKFFKERFGVYDKELEFKVHVINYLTNNGVNDYWNCERIVKPLQYDGWAIANYLVKQYKLDVDWIVERISKPIARKDVPIRPTHKHFEELIDNRPFFYEVDGKVYKTAKDYAEACGISPYLAKLRLEKYIKFVDVENN